MDKELQELSEKIVDSLNQIIRGKVADAYDESAESKLENLTHFLWCHIRDSEVLLDDYKQAGLTVNSIEAEGFHRFALTVKNYLQDNELLYGAE